MRRQVSGPGQREDLPKDSLCTFLYLGKAGELKEVSGTLKLKVPEMTYNIPILLGNLVVKRPLACKQVTFHAEKLNVANRKAVASVSRHRILARDFHTVQLKHVCEAVAPQAVGPADDHPLLGIQCIEEVNEQAAVQQHHVDLILGGIVSAGLMDSLTHGLGAVGFPTGITKVGRGVVHNHWREEVELRISLAVGPVSRNLRAAVRTERSRQTCVGVGWIAEWVSRVCC